MRVASRNLDVDAVGRHDAPEEQRLVVRRDLPDARRRLELRRDLLQPGLEQFEVRAVEKAGAPPRGDRARGGRSWCPAPPVTKPSPTRVRRMLSVVEGLTPRGTGDRRDPERLAGTRDHPQDRHGLGHRPDLAADLPHRRSLARPGSSRRVLASRPDVAPCTPERLRLRIAFSRRNESGVSQRPGKRVRTRREDTR